MRGAWGVGAFLGVVSVTSIARAHQPPQRGETLTLAGETAILRTPQEQPHFTLAATFGALDQGTTGTLAAYGYDHGTAMSLGVNARLVFPLQGCRCMTHGVDAGVLWTDGTTLGAGGQSAWTRGIVDLGYAFRVELPCMRSGTRRWWVTGTLGWSGQLADAGLGDVPAGETAGLNERTVASQRYDHLAMGWHLGASMEVVFDKALVGFGVDLRDLRGLDSDQARTFLLGANLRVGVDLGL
jgi:hypothetical protein